jgi:hypothetical protein
VGRRQLADSSRGSDAGSVAETRRAAAVHAEFLATVAAQVAASCPLSWLEWLPDCCHRTGRCLLLLRPFAPGWRSWTLYESASACT